MIPKLHFHHLLNINVHVIEIYFQIHKTTTTCKSGKNYKRQWMAKKSAWRRPLLDNWYDVSAILELSDECFIIM